MKILFQSLDIDPALYFTGSNKEIEEAEKKEARQAAKLERIIFSDCFQQLTYTNHAGQIRSLHRSTRPGIMFQLSYIDSDGVPAMHENFIQTCTIYGVGAIHSRKDLIQHFINQTLKKSITCELITA